MKDCGQQLGGATLERCCRCCNARCWPVKQLAAEHQVAVVHGGGARLLPRMLAQMGKQSEFIDGLARDRRRDPATFAVMVPCRTYEQKAGRGAGQCRPVRHGDCCGGRPAHAFPRAQEDDHTATIWDLSGEITSVDPRLELKPYGSRGLVSR